MDRRARSSRSGHSDGGLIALARLAGTAGSIARSAVIIPLTMKRTPVFTVVLRVIPVSSILAKKESQKGVS
jgi:hypothetical protein